LLIHGNDQHDAGADKHPRVLQCQMEQRMLTFLRTDRRHLRQLQQLIVLDTANSAILLFSSLYTVSQKKLGPVLFFE